MTSQESDDRITGYCNTSLIDTTHTLMINKSDRTVRRWRSSLIENDGDFHESVHGKHQCSGVLWNEEHLNMFCYLKGSHYYYDTCMSIKTRICTPDSI